MARKAAIPQLPPADNTLPALPVLTAAANQLAVMHVEQEATVRAVAAHLGYQLPADCTDPDLIQRDISANMRRSVEACLEVGRGLGVLKVACEHGNFVARLDVLGLDRSVAVRFMQAAAKFSNVATSQHLTMAIGTQSKLFEMLVLDDEQIEELELTGQTGELKLDDIATMSVKELRATLRETRGNYESQGALIAGKDAKINDLTTQLSKAGKRQSRVKELDPADVGQEIRQEAAMLASQAEVSIRALRAGLASLAEHTEAHGISHDDFMAGLLCQMERTIAELRGEFGIKAAPNGEEIPDWLLSGGDIPSVGQPVVEKAGA